MGYLQDFDRALRERVSAFGLDGTQEDDFVKWIKDEILRSYKNGLSANVEARESVDAPKNKRARDTN